MTSCPRCSFAFAPPAAASARRPSSRRRGHVGTVAIDVRGDAHIAVAFGASDGRRQVVMYADGNLDGFAAPQFVGTTAAGAPFFLGVVAGAPGRGRVLTEDDEAGLAFLRTGPATWTPPQRFEA